MDNLSHSLVGLAVGELVQRSFAPEADPVQQRTRRRLLLSATALASNFPDLDLVLTPLLPAPLGYLLHHRGHTHTLLAALPQALLLVALLWALWPGARTLLRVSANARRALGLAVGAGFLLHMSMDYLNSYGIHPLHPFDSRWFYGDMVFILEPVFWVACGIPLAMLARRPLLRTALAGTLAAVLVFFVLRGFLHWSSLAALAVLGTALGWRQLRAGPAARHALALALLASAGFAAVQGAVSSHGKDDIASALGKLDPRSTVRDIAMTAYPANPLCWSFVSVESDAGAGTYRVRRGRYAPLPGLMRVEDCPAAMGEDGASVHAGTRIALYWESTASLRALRDLTAGSCRFSAWMRFARAPVLGPDSATDARFGTDAAASFATLPLGANAGAPCGAVPQWSMPRRDLLATQAAGR